MILEDRYANAFSEVYVILNNLDKIEYKKISYDIIETIKDNRNKDYIYTLERNKKLKEQKMLPETKAILFNIFRDFLATEEQNNKIKSWQAKDLKKIEDKKKEKYNIDVFENTNNKYIPETNNKLIEIKEKNIWQILINKIKRIFNKDSKMNK